MPYAREHKHPRVQVSAAHAPPRKDDRAHKRLVMTVGVSVAMLVIMALYAASFPYQESMHRTPENTPRWSVLGQDVKDRFAPVQRQWDKIGKIKESLSAAVAAKQVQARSVELLKAKIESASTTPNP